MFKVASIQLAFSDSQSKEERLVHAEEMIERVADADIILLPELWNVGWYSFDLYREYAETLEGETISRLATKAKEANAYLVAGSIVEKVGEDLRNTAVFLNPQGQIIATYSKMHLSNLRGVQEAALMKPGKDIVAVETPLAIFGFGICYDLRFPELYRKMAINSGVEVFLQVSAWPLVRVENWVEMCHVRAAENQCYLVSCNCAGANRGFSYLGHSAVVDPNGFSIAAAGLDETVVRGEIDIAALQRFRQQIPTLKNRVLPV